VRWAVRAGVADPARVAIYGGSYGGYASLVGMTFTPTEFACGVAIVGISNLVTFYETVPPYWRLGVMPLLHKYVGDPARPEDRRRLEAKSPLFKAHQVEHPLLIIHGAMDTRVNVRESEQMVAALKQAGKDVRYVVFPDEGHRRDYGNWRNALRHYAEVEEFQVVLRRVSGLDDILVQIDPRADLAPGGRAALGEKVAHELQIGLGIRASVEVVEPGSLPRWDHKAKRVRDERTEVPF